MDKKYFTDGLLQIAIVLSLLRTDLNNYLNNNFGSYPEIHEIILGQSSAYTQTHIHNLNWYGSAGSLPLHPKNADNYYATSVFRELESLGRYSYRRFDGLDTDVRAWLVSGPAPVPLPAETASNSHSEGQPHPQAGQQSQNLASSNVPLDDNNNNEHSGREAEGAVGPPDQGNDVFPSYPGSELTKEDMDLIEILWRQDMDLGVGREMFDQNLRKELEKERELELQKQRAKEKEDTENLQQPEDQTVPAQDPNVQYIVDNETGEVVAVPIENAPNTDGTNVDTLCPWPPELDETDEISVEQAMRLLEEYPTEGVTHTEIDSGRTATPELNADDVQEALASLIQNAEQFQGQPQVGFQRQESFERSWQEVADLLSLPPGDSAETLDNLPCPTDDIITNNNSPLIHNATLPAPVDNMNNLDFDFDQSMYGTNTHSSAGQTNSMLAPVDNLPTFENSTMGNNSQVSLFNMDTARLIFGNLTNTNTSMDLTQDVLFNNTQNSLFESLMTANNSMEDMEYAQSQNNFNSASELMDIGKTEMNTSSPSQDMQTSSPSHSVQSATPPYSTQMAGTSPRQSTSMMDEVSSDSAVSSMAGSASPMMDVNDTMSVFSNQSSPFDGIEGATGGSDYDDTSSKYGNKFDHVHHDLSYGNYGNREAELNQNYSGSSNESDEGYAPADMRHVKHNHTYPLQPGQQPKESKQAAKEEKLYSNRDEKKAKSMNIPFTMEEIIQSPVEQFNEMMQKYKLTESQLQLIRDIRRRGKNKVAAQNCRKRKMEVITTLEDEVLQLRANKGELLKEQRMIDKEMRDLKEKMNRMYETVFRNLRDDHGHPYDPNQYSLQHTADGDVILVPQNSTSTVKKEHDDKRGRKRKSPKKGN